MSGTPPLAERARTLADGVVPMLLTVCGEDGESAPCQVPAAADEVGDPLLLLPANSAGAQALRATRAGDLPALIEVPDVVELGGAEAVRGRLRLVGWLAAVPSGAQRDAALRIWERHPDEALLEAVEGGPDSALLARLDVAEVSYESTEGTSDICLAAFVAAEPDPVHPSAYEIRRHINHSHRNELAVLARAACGVEPGAAWMWDIDRFGATLLVRRGSLEGDPDHVLVRVPWLLRVDSVDGLQAEMGRAISWARSCTCEPNDPNAVPPRAT